MKFESLESSLKKENKLIISSLKISERLNSVLKIINLFSNKWKFLIIDDEGDEYSLSTKSQNLFKLIFKNKVKILTITASPFANLYKNEKIYDFYKYLKSNSDYFSLDKFKNNYFIYNEKWQIFVMIGFFSWIKIIIENNIKKAQFLINIFSKISDHEKIYKFFSKFLIPNAQDKEKFLSIVEKLEKIHPFNFKNILIKLKILSFIQKLSFRNMKILNSKYESVPANQGYEIIIGGFNLTRGLTFENLFTTIMLNMAKTINCATLIQRARWLGYQKKKKEIMQIFINQKICNAFVEAEDLIAWTKKYKIENSNYKERFNKKKYKYLKI